MPSSTSVILTVRGVDQTRATFRRIRANVALMASQVRMAATAAVAGMAGLGAGVITAAKSFSTLGDRSAQAGVAAQDLNALATGLGIAGAKGATIDNLADALSRMTKATGAVGVGGMSDTLAQIASLETEGERVNALAQTFGRSFGPGLAALVRQGPEAARKGLEDVLALGPRVSSDLVEAGDAIADGWTHAANNIKVGWQESLISIGRDIVEHFGMPADEALAVFGARVRFAMQAAFRYVAQFGKMVYNIFANFRGVWDAVFGEEGLSGIIARNLLHAWNNIVNWGEIIAAKFVWVKDMVAAAFTDDTFEDASKKYQEAVARADKKLAEKNGVADAMFGEASFKKIGENLKNLGVTMDVDLSDLRETRDEAIARITGGAMANVRAMGLAAADGADAAGEAAERALGPLKEAQAVAANSYQAFRIASLSSSGNGGSTPVERAQLATEKNTATLVRNSDKQTRLLEKTAAALSNPENLYTLQST